ncbi:MAG: T9SS type A sorting domain-containing protein [Bacteroidetes bacterium]|nr:T9SS type A sorting domain-containing protein [Bacteroidota bacterium]
MKSKVLKLIFVFLLCSKAIFAQWETVYFPVAGLPQSFPCINSVEFRDFNNGFGAGHLGYLSNFHGCILKTSNNGTSWDTTYSTAMPFGFNDISYTSLATIIAVGQNINTGNLDSGLIVKSTDSGNSWTTLSTIGLTCLSFPSTNIGYVGGINGSILKTIDGGNNWNVLNTGTNSYVRSIFFINDTIGFVCGNDTLLKTTDGGLNWISQPLIIGTGFSLSKIFFPTDSVGYCNTFACGNDLTIFKTTDQGNTWISQYVNQAYCTLSMFFTDNSTGYTVGQFDVSKTTDGGISWNHQTATPPAMANFFDDIMDVFFLNSDTGFIVGNNQFYRTTIAGGATVSVNDISNPDKSTISVYPNPATDQITIELPNSETGKIELSIVNLMGQMIYKQETFDNSKIIDISQFAEGIYLIQAKTEDKKTYNKKIIIAR